MDVNPYVAIINNDPKVLNNLIHLLDTVGYRVKVFSLAKELLESGDLDEINCLILDVFLPGMSGLELQEELIQSSKQLPIIFITSHGDIEVAVRAIKRGALDFLSSTTNDYVVLEAINKAIQQDQHYRLWSAVNRQVISSVKQLTPREYEVMKLMVNGFSTKKIATDLGISPSTVELHRAKVMKKMSVRSVAQLVRIALVNKLFSISQPHMDANNGK